MKNDTNMSQIKQYAIDTFNAEADAIRNLSNLLTDDFDQAVEAILVCTGKVVVTGMGKSGIIGKKIAATLASTGTPAFFLHPGEAYHGDLGMISKNDVVLAIAQFGTDRRGAEADPVHAEQRQYDHRHYRQPAVNAG